MEGVIENAKPSSVGRGGIDRVHYQSVLKLFTEVLSRAALAMCDPNQPPPPIALTTAVLVCIPKERPDHDGNHGYVLRASETRPISVFTRVYRLLTAFYTPTLKAVAAKAVHGGAGGVPPGLHRQRC